MGFTKIQDSDLVDIGVIGLPDTPGLSTAAMQAKLEETSRSVVIPKHNALIDELEATTAAASLGMSAPLGREGTTVQAVVADISSDLATVESEIETIYSEAHTHANKALLDTYDQTNADIAQAIADDHTHSNKALLDTYTQSETNIADAVSKKHNHTNKALLDTYEQTEANLADAVSKKHSHSNKALLDTYTQTESDLASAVADDHTHSNKSLLDSYEQTESDLSDAVSKKHSHSNKAVLDKFSESGGSPLYDGSAFAGDMLQSQYDSDGDVATAGGIASYVSSAISNKISTSSTAGLVKNDGTIDTTTYVSDISGKADKVSSATNGNFAGLDSNGNLTDSGSKASDFLTQHQDISGKADKVASATNGNFAGLDSNGNLTDSGSKASDFLTQHQDISGKADKTDIASVESSTTATAKHEIGQEFYLSGTLYKATATINIGDTITVGTNCELAGTITEQLNGKQDKTLSAQVEGQSTVEGALGALSTNKVGWDVAGKSVKKNYVDVSKYYLNGTTFSVVANGYKVLANSTTVANPSVQYLDNRETTQPYLTAGKSWKIVVDIKEINVTTTAVIAFRTSSGVIKKSVAITAVGRYVLEYTPTENTIVTIFVRMGNTGATGTEYLVFDNLMVIPAEVADLSYEPFIYDNTELDAKKAETTVIGNTEDGATCANPNGYKVGEHFVKNGKFCTCIANTSQGDTWTLNTNYVEGTIADVLAHKLDATIALESNSDLNDLMESGIYIASNKSGISNLPASLTVFSLMVIKVNASYIQQILWEGSDTRGNMYFRRRGGSPLAWGSWYKFTGTVVS